VTTAHEPRGGPGTHLSAEDLSALAEGAQPSAEGAAEHLLECAACRGEVDAMSELLAQFEEWDAPAMPQEVAIRIDASLARESAARAATAEHPAAAAAAARASEAAASPEGTLSGSAQSGTSSAGDAPKPRRRRWRPAPGLVWSLAALVLIAGGLGLIIKLSSSSTSVSANSASGSAASQPFASTRSPEVFGPGAGGENSLPSAPVLASGSPLAVWTDQALSGQRPDASINTPCLSDPAFKGSHELAVTSGTYNGADATLVIYANPSDPTTVLAVVYATPCTATSFRVLDRGLVVKPAAGNTP
jgi:hypothetical protein